MPRIPKYNGQQVSQDPIRAPRVSTEAPLEAFGGGRVAANNFGAAADMAGQVAHIAGQEYQKQYQDAVNLQSMEATNKILQEEMRIKSSMEKLSGPDAQRASGVVGGEFQKFYQGLEKSLQNEHVKRQVYEKFLERQGLLDGWARGTADAKMKEHDSQEFAAEGKVLTDSVSLDPSMPNVVTAVAGRKMAIEQFARRSNRGEAWVKAAQDDASSGLYLTALRTLARQNDLVAGQFYAENKQEFKGNDAETAAQLIEATDYRGRSQREVTRILAGSMPDGEQGPPAPPTEKETYAAVDKIEDPKLQDMVRQRLENRWEEIRRIQANALREDAIQAANIIEGNPSLDAIPIDLYERLPLGVRKSLQERANQIVRGEGPRAGSDKYFDLLRMSVEDPEKFVGENLTLYRHTLTEAERKELARDQIGILKGDEATAKKTRGFLNVQETANLTTADMSLDNDEKREFLRALNRDYVLWKKNNEGKEPEAEDAEKLVDDLIGSERRWYKLWLGKSPDKKYKRYDDIPEGERKAIETALRQAGEAPTRGRVIELYNKKGK